ncbi:MAG: hypothetical protein WCP31_11370 [Chloroflexales bacterium]
MAKKQPEGYDLPRFRKALEAYDGTLPVGTRWRYSKGMLPPPFGPLLVEHPELAAALAKDAADLVKKKRLQQKQVGATEGPDQ